jgi:hypothetical protein
MSSAKSQLDLQIIRGELFNCNNPEDLQDAIQKAQINLAEARGYLNSYRWHFNQCKKLLDELKSKQTTHP